MIKHCYIVLSFLISFTVNAQSPKIEYFKQLVSGKSADSVFQAIDLKLEELDSIQAGEHQIIELLEFKEEMADSFENRVMKSYAYNAMLNYPKAFSTEDYFKLLKKQGNLLAKLGDTDKAMNLYFTAAEMADSLSNDTLLADVYKNIGTQYKNQGNAELSLKYLSESLEYYTAFKDTINIIGNYMTMGNAYKLRREEDSAYIDTALIYYNKSLSLSRTVDYQRGMAGNYNNIGNAYRFQKKLQESLDQFFLALEINQASQNQQWISYNYHNIGITYQQLEQHSSAVTYLQKSLNLKEALNDQQHMGGSYENIATSYAALGRYKEAYENLLKGKQILNLLQNAGKRRMSQELEAKFQNQKKAAQINALEAEQALQALEIDKKQKDLDHQEELRSKEKKLIYALGFILLSLIAIIFVFWRNGRQRKKYTEELKQKNGEIERANHEINQARINLEYKNQEITDSINYAKRIQAAILPSKKTLKTYLNEAFVMYLPKDIVAGDFYWTERIDNTILFAVADCTGHGVPGAMVSVICHNALNATIKQMGLTDPGEILDATTELVLTQFEKSEEEVRDGMDIALCAFDTETRTLRYAGANTPLWLVRGKEIIKYAATRQPVGNHTTRVKFESNTIPIQKGDSVYLSSDGYTDQFGGEKGKKFLNKRFKSLLIKIAQYPVEKQAEMLLSQFESWKQDYGQVDDVCVLGAKVD